MELLLSNILPLRFAKRNTEACFKSLVESAEKIRIATGYISADALVELKRMIEENKGPYLELMIGMHGFEGFTNLQYEAAKCLDEYLRINNMGFVKVSTAFKFHGKIYSFSSHNKVFASILGSSNLSSIFDSQNLYEADLFIEDPDLTNQLDSFITNFSNNACTFLCEHVPTIIERPNEQLEGHDGVEKVKMEEYINVLSQRTNILFKIPLKSSKALQSNLNAYFGKGRENKRGFVKPRHWYEIEFIVPKEIANLPGYPSKGANITVYTDDLWKFECTISGDNKKNIRSAKDLKILGRWLKGRLENKGSLKMGALVTEKTLEHYGRDNVDLISTANPLIWMLDFKP